MANVFTRSNDATPQPNRNTFDGSFVNNLTLKMGQITPCFLKEVIPGDSFKISPTFGFNFQPFVFPVQTDMQANLHFFYVRNRALWRGWQDFITKTNNVDGDSTPPYILLNESNRDMFDTGKIGDYLGVPTIYYDGNLKTVADYMWNSDTLHVNKAEMFDGVSVCPFVDPENALNADFTLNSQTFWNTPVPSTSAVVADKDIVMNALNNIKPQAFTLKLPYARTSPFDLYYSPMAYGTLQKYLRMLVYPKSVLRDTLGNLANSVFGCSNTRNASIVSGIYCIYDKTSKKYLLAYRHTMQCRRTDNEDFANYVDVFDLDSSSAWNAESILHVDDACECFDDASSLTFRIKSDEYLTHELVHYFICLNSVGSFDDHKLVSAYSVGCNNFQYLDYTVGVPNSERELSDLPFASVDNPDGLRISALPFRAVEACYNAFYRDDRNNPLIIDGQPFYNVWVENKNGGADTTHYHMYQRNWEADVFTTAVQSPQQGVAPLVGVTGSGVMTFQDEEGKTYTLTPTIGEDGHTITGISSYSSDMPVGTLRAMVDTISSGISINDFRNVNALQRWLETNMRKGLRYKDQIEAHFGTAPTYSELDMPEFIGGMSRRVEVNKVVQTSSDVDGSPLGTLGGNATILGGSNSDISKFCDEHGWIIGFITISPKPVYSQQLNKQLLKTELLDFYFPEFAHIGYQPILNREIAPLQCRSSEQLYDVFGYQRAWYEYLANVDEVHGDFRTNLKDYIIHRVFEGVPELSEEFLTISTNEANEVFAVQDDSDKIFGQIYFDVKMKRPIPAIGIPKLEVG